MLRAGDIQTGKREEYKKGASSLHPRAERLLGLKVGGRSSEQKNLSFRSCSQKNS